MRPETGDGEPMTHVPQQVVCITQRSKRLTTAAPGNPQGLLPYFLLWQAFPNLHTQNLTLEGMALSGEHQHRRGPGVNNPQHVLWPASCCHHSGLLFLKLFLFTALISGKLSFPYFFSLECKLPNFQMLCSQSFPMPRIQITHRLSRLFVEPCVVMNTFNSSTLEDSLIKEFKASLGYIVSLRSA